MSLGFRVYVSYYNYYNRESILFTIESYYGNLNNLSYYNTEGILITIEPYSGNLS